MGRFEAWRLWFGLGVPQLEERPALIIGAGHATHMTLLACAACIVHPPWC